MSQLVSSVQAHYGCKDLVARMMTALAAAGHDVSNPTVNMLNLIDQLHVADAANISVGARSVLLRNRHGSHGSANGFDLLFPWLSGG